MVLTYPSHCETQRTSHSARGSPWAPAALHAPWCTSSSSSPHAESSPPPFCPLWSPTHARKLRSKQASLLSQDLVSHFSTLGKQTWWMAPSISERLDTLVMDWTRISRFFCTRWMISIDWLSSSHRGIRAYITKQCGPFTQLIQTEEFRTLFWGEMIRVPQCKNATCIF